MHTRNSFNNSKTTSYYNTISNSENRNKITERGEGENEITFSDKSQNCCVCFVIMTGPVSAISEIRDPDKIRRYYSAFINTTAVIARNFNAKIIKNTASSLVFYFPKTSTISLASSPNNDNGTNTYEPAFRDVLECGITMIAASDVINDKLREEGGMPPLYYRISADYGRVEVARSISSPDTDDLFGTTMNICAKINSMAPPNGMVIGSNLYGYYCIARRKSSSPSLFEDSDDGSDEYNFKKIGEYSITGSKNPYSVYSVLVSKNRLDTIITPIHKSLKSHSDHEYDQQLQHQKQENTNNILLVDCWSGIYAGMSRSDPKSTSLSILKSSDYLSSRIERV
jgi:two-component system, OmpR family, response regulator ChvI